MRISKLKFEIVPTLLVIFFSFATLGKMYFPIGLLNHFFNYGMAIVSAIGILYTILTKLNLKNILIIFGAFIIFIIPVAHNDNLDLYQRFIMPYLYLGIGLLLVNFKLNYRLVSISFIIHALFFIAHFPLGIGHPIFNDTSRNYHSVIVIYNAILFYISTYQNNTKIKLYPVIMTLLICFWSVGRSGILVASLFFLVIYYEKLKSGNASTKHIKVVFSFMFATFLIFILLLFDDNIFYRYIARFTEEGFQDNARSRIIDEYFHLMTSSTNNFLFGVNTEFNNLFQRYGYNLHNSYLRLHSLYGFFGLALAFVLFLNSIRKYWKNHKFYILLMLVILVRISTDQAAFFGIFDPLLIYFTLNSFIVGKNKDLQINY